MSKFNTSIFFTFFLISISINSYAIYNNDWENKVSPILIQKLNQNKNEFFVIYLNKQSVVLEKNVDKNTKSKLAYEQLMKENYASQEEIVEVLKNNNYKYKRFFIVNCISVYGDIDLVKELTNYKSVAYISYDSPIVNTYSMDIHNRNSNEILTTWGIEAIDADSVWNLGYFGQGVVVGGQDTGYDWTHPALQSKYRGYNEGNTNHSYNWHDAIHEINVNNNDSIIDPSNNPCGLNSLVPCDDNGHGTHTMGTMVGGTDNLAIGVAPESNWIGCRNMERGWGKPSTYIECFEWFLAPTDINNENPDPLKSPDVINNSWGCPESEGCDATNWQYMELALNNLRASGVFVVVSAGNDGINTCGSINTPPAIFEQSFTVGALREFTDTINNVYVDTITSFSSRGPVIIDGSNILKPDITAPGQAVLSSIPNNKYAYFNGTSMAGPHVVGVVALILSANPELKGNTDKIEEILINSAIPKPETDSCTGILEYLSPNSIYGYGKLSALKAVEEALNYTSIIENKNNETISIYPNPSTDQIFINSEVVQKINSYDIFNQFGNKVKTGIYTKDNPITISNLKSGIYFLKIYSKEKNHNFKFIKI
ncbi:MAG: S8 family serine peptidase [Saprospiraceae bacterium]